MAIVVLSFASTTIHWLWLLAFLSLLMLQSCLADDQLKLHRLSSRKLCPSCNTRFEFYPFFKDSLAAQESISDQTGHSVWILIRVSVSAAAVMMLLASVVWSISRGNALFEEQENDLEAELRGSRGGRTGNDYTDDTSESENGVARPHLSLCSLDLIRKVTKYFSGENKMDYQVDAQGVPLFSLNVIYKATEYFSDKNWLGSGGFGDVYKGLLGDGKAIAVKRLARISTYSTQGIVEFEKEVTLLSKLRHKNVARLLGCCRERNELILIYEYMPNKSIHEVLFGSEAGQILEWKTRINIIKGIAQGLLYLHEALEFKIIHKDLKPSNVLLDDAMNPKISDFGMADMHDVFDDEAIDSRVRGTFGYLAPEYFWSRIYSVKTDIFSFGVSLLEIISGRRNHQKVRDNVFKKKKVRDDDIYLLEYAWKLWCDGKTIELMDPAFIQSCDRIELIRYINIGLLCVQNDPTDRPTMSSVVLMLESTEHDANLPRPNQPPFVYSQVESTQSSSFQSSVSINEMSLSIELPR